MKANDCRALCPEKTAPQARDWGRWRHGLENPGDGMGRWANRSQTVLDRLAGTAEGSYGKGSIRF